MRRSIVLSVLLIAGSAVACARPASSPTTAASAEPTSTPTVIPFHVESQSVGGEHPTVTEMENGHIVYKLRALSEEGDSSRGDVGHFEQPHIIFHAKDGTILIADAPQATITRHDKSVLMTGGVHARRQDGTTLTCRTLRYDGQSERIHAAGDVVLAKIGGSTLAYDFLDSDVKLEHVHLWKAKSR
jgi:LPS export ABC transporter protein LptC